MAVWCRRANRARRRRRPLHVGTAAPPPIPRNARRKFVRGGLPYPRRREGSVRGPADALNELAWPTTGFTRSAINVLRRPDRAESVIGLHWCPDVSGVPGWICNARRPCPRPKQRSRRGDIKSRRCSRSVPNGGLASCGGVVLGWSLKLPIPLHLPFTRRSRPLRARDVNEAKVREEVVGTAKDGAAHGEDRAHHRTFGFA